MTSHLAKRSAVAILLAAALAPAVAGSYEDFFIAIRNDNVVAAATAWQRLHEVWPGAIALFSVDPEARAFNRLDAPSGRLEAILHRADHQIDFRPLVATAKSPRGVVRLHGREVALHPCGGVRPLASTPPHTDPDRRA